MKEITYAKLHTLWPKAFFDQGGSLATEVLDVRLEHGTRQPSHAQIQRTGICAFTPEQATRVVEAALAHFKKPIHLARQVRVEPPGRWTIWASGYPPGTPDAVARERTCQWARRNPEIVWWTLLATGVPRGAVEHYLQETFGPPFRVTLNRKPTVGQVKSGIGLNNVALGVTCLPPYAIVRVEAC